MMTMMVIVLVIEAAGGGHDRDGVGSSNDGGDGGLC